MGFFTDPKTGKMMDAEKFIKREKKEWGDALGTFAKECIGAGTKQRDAMFLTSEADLKKMMGSAHNFKGRR
jgi:hypothetical protein